MKIKLPLGFVLFVELARDKGVRVLSVGLAHVATRQRIAADHYATLAKVEQGEQVLHHQIMQAMEAVGAFVPTIH